MYFVQSMFCKYKCKPTRLDFFNDNKRVEHTYIMAIASKRVFWMPPPPTITPTPTLSGVDVGRWDHEFWNWWKGTSAKVKTSNPHLPNFWHSSCPLRGPKKKKKKNHDKVEIQKSVFRKPERCVDPPTGKARHGQKWWFAFLWHRLLRNWAGR